MPSRKKKSYNLNSKIRSALRKVWLWSPQRAEALRKAKAGRGRWLCAGCESIVEKVSVDHITPCGPINDLNAFRDRLFVGATGLQCLCAPCHAGKTAADRILAKVRALSESESN